MSQEIRRNSGSEAGDPDLPIGGLCGLLYHPCGSENRPKFIPWEISSVSLMMFPYEMVNHHIYIYMSLMVSLVMVNNDVYHQCYYGFVCLSFSRHIHVQKSEGIYPNSRKNPTTFGCGEVKKKPRC